MGGRMKKTAAQLPVENRALRETRRTVGASPVAGTIAGDRESDAGGRPDGA